MGSIALLGSSLTPEMEKRGYLIDGPKPLTFGYQGRAVIDDTR